MVFHEWEEGGGREGGRGDNRCEKYSGVFGLKVFGHATMLVHCLVRKRKMSPALGCIT